jgi:hypothetical protein
MYNIYRQTRISQVQGGLKEGSNYFDLDYYYPRSAPSSPFYIIRLRSYTPLSTIQRAAKGILKAALLRTTSLLKESSRTSSIRATTRTATL